MRLRSYWLSWVRTNFCSRDARITDFSLSETLVQNGLTDFWFRRAAHCRRKYQLLLCGWLKGIYQLLVWVTTKRDWRSASKLLLTFTNFFSFKASDDSKYRLLIWQEVWNNLLTSDLGRTWEYGDCFMGGEKRLTNFWFENPSMNRKSLLTSENRASVYSLANQENLLTFKIGKVVWLEKYLLTSGSRY